MNLNQMKIKPISGTPVRPYRIEFHSFGLLHLKESTDLSLKLRDSIVNLHVRYDVYIKNISQTFTHIYLSNKI